MIPRTKVTTACQNCQTKKIRCSGPPECTKCREKNQICNFITERKRRGPTPRIKRDVIESLATRRAKIGYCPPSFVILTKKTANISNIIDLNFMGHVSELESKRMSHAYYNDKLFRNQNEVRGTNTQEIQLRFDALINDSEVESQIHHLNHIDKEKNMNVEFRTPRANSFSSLNDRPHHNPSLFPENITYNVLYGIGNKKESKEEVPIYEVAILFA
ncbi:4144_t:CDS:2 [Cetraspora pellucida]|uniref:4144_t:CDS:1 n=1 Tax=Cetraspora pellucida TaxID=1433469 RepID=A0A9N9CA66_9GLOM|nr:4144_t:CDS:2 [Cetraspora pellucida]